MITLSSIIQDLGNRFPHYKLCFALEDIPQDIVLPKEWEKFGVSLEIAPAYPDSWSSFLNEFPSIIRLLNNCLLGTAVLLGSKIEMVYIFHDGNSLYYYVGGAPVTKNSGEAIKLNHLPGRLQDFYREVHDGYTFFPARSMGPQCLSDQSRVCKLTDEEDCSFAENWITVFSNGGGDYVAVEADKQNSTEGLIWWHEEPTSPELDIDIFEIMDAWMAIFLEDTKTREELFAKPH